MDSQERHVWMTQERCRRQQKRMRDAQRADYDLESEIERFIRRLQASGYESTEERR